MELYVFDRNLDFRGVLDNFVSLRWIRRYNQAGEFELHCSLNPETLKLLQRENIIWKKDDTEAGYIEYRQLSQDVEGKEILAVKGKFLSGYLNRRIIWSTENLNMTTENAMRTLVNNHAIITANPDRAIPNLTLGDLKGFTQLVSYQTSYKNLLEEIERLSQLSELGFKVDFDTTNKILVFSVYEGLNRSVNQNVNTRCIFAKEFENVLEQTFTDSLNNYKNIALVAGAGEGEDRKIITVGSNNGLDRFEGYIDARDLRNMLDDEVLSEEEYDKLLIERGNTKLAELKDIKTFESKINLNGNLEYKKDFELGDIVTIVNRKWGVTLDSRITEVEEVYEQEGLNINITFGNRVPTLLDKIKQQIK